MLKLDGSPLDLDAIPPAVKRVQEVLLNAPADEIFSTAEMDRKFRLSERTLDRAQQHFPELTRLYRQRRVWGHPEAIAELDRVTA